MAITMLSSPELNQDTGRAKTAAQSGPVFILTVDAGACTPDLRGLLASRGRLSKHHRPARHASRSGRTLSASHPDGSRRIGTGGHRPPL